MSAFTTAIEYKHTYDRYNTEQNGSTITKFTQKKSHRQNEQCVTTNEYHN